MEFYNVAWQVMKDKSFFGIGFNSPITKYITKDYEPKYPADSKYTFLSITTGVETFDNMALLGRRTQMEIKTSPSKQDHPDPR